MVVMLHSSFLFFCARFHPSTYAENRSRNAIIYTYMIQVSACVYAVARAAGKVLHSEQGPLQAQACEQQCQAPVFGPADSCRAPYQFHQGGFGRILMCAVKSRLPHNRLPLAGGLSVRCKTQKRVGIRTQS